MTMLYYVLLGKLAVPEPDYLKWATMFNGTDRYVALDRIGPIAVSTIFLGLDRSYGRGTPRVFETIVFRGGNGNEEETYTSWEEAEAGHKKWVEKVRNEIRVNNHD